MEEHLAKIADRPHSRDIPHWSGEVREWIKQVEDVLPYLGKKTSAEWAARIREWKGRLGE